MKRFLIMAAIMIACVSASRISRSYAQGNVVINLMQLEGLPLTPDNAVNFQIISRSKGGVQVNGTIKFRNAPYSISYSFPYTLREGVNNITAEQVHPQWQFSSGAVQDLFTLYHQLPGGTYEYCVTVVPQTPVPEVSGQDYEECIYHRDEDMFVITLTDPENNAKIHEYNPLLTWVANSPLAAQLTYRLRLAEIKQGQNAVTAIMHNQLSFDDKNIQQNSLVYPVFAKPLEAGKSYAWTVDAYYKNVLLGGAETWKFTLLDDTVATKWPIVRSYIEIAREKGTTSYYITGELKIKYVLEKTKTDELGLTLMDDSNQPVTLSLNKLAAKYGDNRYEINLRDNANLKHLKKYTLIVKNGAGEQYQLPFKYVNPDFIK